jgi:hypothetical protein
MAQKRTHQSGKIKNNEKHNLREAMKVFSFLHLTCTDASPGRLSCHCSSAHADGPSWAMRVFFISRFLLVDTGLNKKALTKDLLLLHLC